MRGEGTHALRVWMEWGVVTPKRTECAQHKASGIPYHADPGP